MINLSYKQQIAFNSLSIILGNALYALTVVLFLAVSYTHLTLPTN